MRLIYFTLFYLTTVPVWSQPDILSQQTIGGTANDVLFDIEINGDTYVFGGGSNSNISGEKTENSRGSNDFWILMQNSTGSPMWQRTIGGAQSDVCKSICVTDSGIMAGGVSYSGISGDKTETNRGIGDYWLVKLNGSGIIEWQKTIGGNGLDVLTSVANTSDGGYVVGGWSDSNISGEKDDNARASSIDYWIVKIGATGLIEWQKTFGGEGVDNLNVLKQTSDAGYILGGSSSSSNSFDKTGECRGLSDYWILKLDSAGNIVWQTTAGGSGNDQLTDLVECPDGSFIAIGYSSSDISGDKTENSRGSSDYWIVSLHPDGTLGWQRTIGGNSYDEAYTICPTVDSQYLIGGTSASSISGEKNENSRGLADSWIVKIDGTGNITWQKTIGGDSADSVYAIKQTSDAKFILGSNSHSGISGEKNDSCRGETDFWIVGLEPDLLSTTDNLNNSFKVYPNPTKKTVNIELGVVASGTLMLTDINGKILEKRPYYEVSSLSTEIVGSAGIYFVILKDILGRIFKYKIVKQ